MKSINALKPVPNGNLSSVEIALKVIRGVMIVNQIKPADGLITPFNDSGQKFKNKAFEVHAEDWSECKCSECWEKGWSEERCKCGWRPQEWNFKWRDFEVSWYKYLGRGMRQNRLLSEGELKQMLNECILSLINHNESDIKHPLPDFPI